MSLPQKLLSVGMCIPILLGLAQSPAGAEVHADQGLISLSRSATSPSRTAEHVSLLDELLWGSQRDRAERQREMQDMQREMLREREERLRERERERDERQREMRREREEQRELMLRERESRERDMLQEREMLRREREMQREMLRREQEERQRQMFRERDILGMLQLERDQVAGLAEASISSSNEVGRLMKELMETFNSSLGVKASIR